ncbi:MAG: hypothetical protein V8R40_03265 [Dysosmobacter sp.]
MERGAGELCAVFDDSLFACRGWGRSARMRVVGDVYDAFWAQDGWEMRGFCDVYFEEL